MLAAEVGGAHNAGGSGGLPASVQGVHGGRARGCKKHGQPAG